ncbi:conserved domain protein [Hyphomonas neptunium ATCC 15444]|uniref:Conserved domain protein n=2 Tax=Hyphomonas TaxID=85 RepID=Q0C1K8_HYPNA|nr:MULTISPECIES: DUF2497 domain-containing protein [Hyphomonas]ABI75679.1 conserved domain protein [Hyphomonas neptunium ATCC 15444]KCZ92531.1 hypothetical protein HHI_11146 [Hyphomonas hirschiana VP5]
MANEAHKEPTMEEILASIRKIIADDGPAPTAGQPVMRDAAPESAGSRPNFSYDNDADDLGMFEGDEPDLADDIADEIAEEFTTEIKGPEFSFEAILGASKAREAEPAPAPLPEPEPEPYRPAAQPVARAFQPAPEPEPKMPAAPRYANEPLTDANTAESAAGALGKLISKMDMGSDNTLEGLVRELLKPMVKEWLDANLARIVEEKVEAEVQRIARMAR